VHGERAWPIPILEERATPEIYTEELVKVPWLVVDSEDRPTIVAEEVERDDTSVDQDVVAERLRNLGYAE
jgi:hypothetical protein